MWELGQAPAVATSHHLETPSSTEEDTQPATLPGTIQEPRQHELQADAEEMPAKETDKGTHQTTEEPPQDGTTEENLEQGTTMEPEDMSKGDQGAGQLNAAVDKDETQNEEWHGDWWKNQTPWSWDEWTDYGAWGYSNWSGDYWKGDYQRAKSFDSQRSDLTSPEWVCKTWGREDTQDFEDHQDR